MISDGTQDCLICQYFQRLDTNGGICHRYPPVLVSGHQTTDRHAWVQPFVLDHGWCGEFQSRPLQTEVQHVFGLE